MNTTPGLAPQKPSNRPAPRGPTFERRRWPVEDRQLVRTLFGTAWSADLIDALPNLSVPPTSGPNPLRVCLEDIRDRYLHAHGLRGTLHFENDAPFLGIADSPLRSVLEHLVEGALRENGAKDAFCHVGVSEQDADFVTLYIRDNGRELPECSLDALRRFVRESKTEHVPERVYRLFLADNLVQWLGGRMWVGPTPNGNGSSVFVRLPRRTATQ